MKLTAYTMNDVIGRSRLHDDNNIRVQDFGVFEVVKIQIQVLWFVTHYSSQNGGSKDSWNVGILPQHNSEILALKHPWSS
jgi:hypothetical protein